MRVSFDKAKVIRLDERARQLNLAANDAQRRFLNARDRAEAAKVARRNHEAMLSLRIDAAAADDPELASLLETEAAEAAEAQRLADQRDRLTERWRVAAALIQRVKDTLRKLGAPAVAELEVN